jgi:hypothetical protein
MIDTEALANYVAANTNASINDSIAEKPKNYLVPKPPKKGQYIICQWCGQKMLPEDFSKDPKIRKWEFKWQLHWKCREAALHECDEQSGILEDRNNKLGISNIEQFVTPEDREYVRRSRAKRGL